jgi:hypothetical protein
MVPGNIVVTEHDILSGKEATDPNPRNVQFFSHIVENQHEAFTEADNKCEFVTGLVDSLRSPDCRFLRKKADSKYVDIVNKKAIQKVKDA